MVMGQEKLPKIKAKRSDKSVLAVAEKSHTTQEPSRLSHVCRFLISFY